MKMMELLRLDKFMGYEKLGRSDLNFISQN